MSRGHRLHQPECQQKAQRETTFYHKANLWYRDYSEQRAPMIFAAVIVIFLHSRPLCKRQAQEKRGQDQESLENFLPKNVQTRKRVGSLPNAGGTRCSQAASPRTRPVGIRETFFSAHYVQKTVWVFSGNLYTPGMSSEHADAQIAPQAPVPAGGNGADNGAADIPPKALGMRVGAVRTPLGVLLGGAAVVLALMVGLLAFISIDRSEAAMARLLAEKGSSLIMALKAFCVRACAARPACACRFCWKRWLPARIFFLWP